MLLVGHRPGLAGRLAPTKAQHPTREPPAQPRPVLKSLQEKVSELLSPVLQGPLRINMLFIGHGLPRGSHRCSVTVQSYWTQGSHWASLLPLGRAGDHRLTRTK